ncbi:MAG: NADPH-dependent assimilatory sulfite reductase hemoprotein subunit [Deltaproteobacteria bacterium]|nr:NADPH-dependent assimilatory sulfite reductase hemoprotein subunit [Deltaproteobacteria bacterium]
MAKAEVIKESSHFLRGGVAEELNQETARFSAANAQILKFHGMYQQEDRDSRQERKREGQEKAHMFMLRIKVPGGRVTPEQYLVHDALASRFGNGTLRITARQDFQLHGVLKSDIKETLKTLNATLLSTMGACGDVVRNVVLCPRPAADSIERELWQHVSALSGHFTPKTRAYAEIWLDGEKVATVSEEEEEPLYGRTYLPRKFKIGVALPWDNCVDVLAQDLGFVAIPDRGQVSGFNVYVGGGQGMTHNKPATFPALGKPLAWVTGEQVVPLATAVVEMFRDWGDRENRKHARIKYLVAERGIDWVRKEVEKRLGYVLVASRPVALSGAHSHLGWHRQEEGLWSLGVYVESGRIADTETQRRKTAFRRIVERLHPGIRLTTDQNILFTDVPASQRGEVEDILRGHGIALAEEVAPVRHRAMACPALPTCGLALSEAERVLPSLLQQIEQTLQDVGLEDEAPVVRVTGCPNGCARPYTAEIGIVGRSGDLYVLYLGGSHLGTRLGVPVLEMVRGQDLVPSLRPLLLAFREEREAGEYFGDFCHRIGPEQARRIMADCTANGNGAAFYVVTDGDEVREQGAALA